MNTPSQEELLGYVLGALDAQEQRDLQHQIDHNPDLEDQLLEIRSSLLPLDYVETSGPRPGLARRTCESVAYYRTDSDHDNPISQPEQSHDVDLSDQPTRHLLRVSSWSLTDVLTTIAFLSALAAVLLPALSYSRYHSRLLACQNNMAQLGKAFLNYSETNNGNFVEIPRSGPLAVSGCFAPILKEQGWIKDDQLLACAGLGSTTPVVHIPSVDVIKKSSGEQLAHYQRTMGGHYGYTMGYRNDQGYFPPKNLGRTNAILLADRPSPNEINGPSSNHDKIGQNCLFEDGSVRFVRGDSIGEDAIFMNDYNMVAPGCGPTDNVIASSHLSPAIAELMASEINSTSKPE